MTEPNPPFTPFKEPDPSVVAAKEAEAKKREDEAKAKENEAHAAKVAKENEAKAAEVKAKLEADANAKKVEDDKRAERINKEVDKQAHKLEEDRVKEREDCIVRATAILRLYGNMESNIPVSNEYWTLMNRYRSLTKG